MGSAIADAIAALEGVSTSKAAEPAPEAELLAATETSEVPEPAAPVKPVEPYFKAEESKAEEPKAEPPAQEAEPAEPSEEQPVEGENTDEYTLEEQLEESRRQVSAMMHTLDAIMQGRSVPGFAVPTVAPRSTPQQTPAAAEQQIPPPAAPPLQAEASPGLELSEDDYVKILTDPTEGKRLFEQSLSRAAQLGAQLGRQQVIVDIVPMVNQALEARTAIAGWFAREENADVAPLSNYVTRAAAQLGAQDKNLTFDDAMKQAAEIVRGTLGLSRRKVAAAVSSAKQASLTPPRRFARGATPRPAERRKEDPQLTEVQRTLEAFEKLED